MKKKLFSKEVIKEFLSPQLIRRVLQYALYMFVVLVVQDIVIAHIRIAGICAFMLPAAVAAVGMFEGAIWGAMFGLVMGLFSDMLNPATVITYTVLFPALAFTVGFISQFFINRRFVGYMVCSIGALLVTGIVQIVNLTLTDAWSLGLVFSAVFQAILSVPFAVLAYFPPAKWIE